MHFVFAKVQGPRLLKHAFANHQSLDVQIKASKQKKPRKAVWGKQTAAKLLISLGRVAVWSRYSGKGAARKTKDQRDQRDEHHVTS